MSSSSGLLIFFDEQHRRDLIQERMDGTYDSFSDALSVPDWDIRQLSVALLSFSDSTIDYIALVKKGKRVVTSKFKAEFSDLVDLGSIPIAKIETRLKENIKHYFIRSSRGIGGAVPNKTWLAVIKAIKEIRPNTVHDIDRLLSLRRYAGLHLSGEAAEILLQEREALGAALDIFSGSNQLRERVLGAWAPLDSLVSDIDASTFHARLSMPESGKSSFLRGIPSRYLTEEPALQHDLFSWDGLTPHGVYQQFTYVAHAILLSSHPVDAARIEILSRFSLSVLRLRATLSPKLHTLPLPVMRVGVRNCRRYGRLILTSAIK